jgi:NAD(P)-dependent dehydrogenase (short-subunit alcohol dehydrogenase family)
VGLKELDNLIQDNKKWSIQDIPNLSGKIAVVTGANSGTGYEVSKAIASKRSQVIMACRSVEKGELAAAKIREEFPDSSLKVMALDLADLSSINSFSKEFLANYEALHILCNNAGVMQTPDLKTADGFELQLGTNHLGHFALTGLLLDLLMKTSDSRIVTVSSGAHRFGNIHFDDLMLEKSYGSAKAYSQSKLANLLFAYELQRRLENNGSSAISVAAHPGFSSTNLQLTGPGMGGRKLWVWLYRLIRPFLAQSAEMGSLPILYAAIAEQVRGGDYFGPRGFVGMRGHPKKVESNEASHDKDAAKKLWDISTELTKVKYSL